MGDDPRDSLRRSLVIAVDTNILVYAHREEMEWHTAADGAIRGLAGGRAAWAIPWPCIHEFLAIVTHPRIFDPPTPRTRAVEQVDAWIESPTLLLLGETGDHWKRMREILAAGRVAGPRVHDARIFALCLGHGIDELWSADRDFSRFTGVAVRNPLVG
jgi:uncharacterized protein